MNKRQKDKVIMTLLRSEIIWHIYSRKDSPLWWAWKYDPKSPSNIIRQSTGKKNNQFTREEVSRIINPGSSPQYPNYSIQWFEEYIQEKLNMEDIAVKTRKLYFLSLWHLKELFGPDYSIHNLGRDTIDKYKSRLVKLGRSSTTINIYLRHLRALFERLLIDGKIDRNPFYRFKSMKENNIRKALTFSELREFLEFVKENSTEDMYHLIRIYAGTGRRRNEILYLTRDDVDLEKGIYYPVNIKSRGKDKLVRSIPDNLIDDFRYFLQSERQLPFLFHHRDTITHEISELLKKAGFQDYSLHSLRHTYLTILNEMNYSVR